MAWSHLLICNWECIGEEALTQKGDLAIVLITDIDIELVKYL